MTVKHSIASCLIISLMVLCSGSLSSAPQDIPVSRVPDDVIRVLNEYLSVLSSSSSVDAAASELVRRGIVAGHLLRTDKSGMPSDVTEFSLKKDFSNVKFYAVPAVITRVSFYPDDTDGFGDTLIRGDRYKIFIKKKEGVPGMPAPIPVIKPGDGKAKIVSVIGSL